MASYKLVIYDDQDQMITTFVTNNITVNTENKWELVRRILQDAFIYAGLNIRRKDL